MKLTTNRSDFTPFSLNIEFESKKEVQQFYTLFNFAPITDSVPDLPSEQFRSELEKQNNIHRGYLDSEIRRNIKEYCELLY